MQACLKNRAKMGHRGFLNGGLESVGFLGDTQVTETESGNSDGLHSQALFRCAHLHVCPGDVCKSGSAVKCGALKVLIRTFRKKMEEAAGTYTLFQ